MTPEQALQVLEQMAARAMGTRGDHEAVAEALQVLAALLAPAPDPDPAE